jgi:hypothetical protein
MGMMSFLVSNQCLQYHFQQEDISLNDDSHSKRPPSNNLIEEEIHHCIYFSSSFHFPVLSQYHLAIFGQDVSHLEQPLFEVVAPPPELI